MYLLPYHHNKNLFFLKPRAARAMKNKKVTDEPLFKTKAEKFAKKFKVSRSEIHGE